MQSVVRSHHKSIDEYRHNIKLLKYHLKKEEKINQTLKYKEYKKSKKTIVQKNNVVEKKCAIYNMVYIVQGLNQKTKDMGMVLGDIFRMADYAYEGQIGKQQFMRTIMRLKSSLDEGTINEMFYAIDTDFNNSLSQDQYNQFLWAHGGSNNQEALKFQKKAAQLMAAKLKKKNIKVMQFLDRTVDPCPAQEVLLKLKQLQLNINYCMILLKIWDPSLKGEVKHQIYKKSMQNVKQKDETQIQNQKFERGIKELCVIFFDRKLNPIVIFEEAQADGQAGISQMELYQGLKKLLPQQVDYQVRKWVNLINLNGDNQITREQFISAIRSFYSIQQIDKYTTQYQNLHPQLKRAINNQEIPSSKIIQQLSIAIEDSGMTKTQTFNRIDINKNGLVDKEELTDGLKEIGISIGLIAKVLTVFDRDASGQITLDQWLNILGQDVQMEQVDLPPPPPTKKDKKIPKKQQQKPKKEQINKTSQAKKKQPLKNQDKNKTVKQSQKKQSKKIIRSQKQQFLEDEINDTKTQMKQSLVEQQQYINIDEIQQQVAQNYGMNQNKVLSCFRKVVNNRKEIKQNQLGRCLEDVLKKGCDDKVVKAIFQTNISSNGTFQYLSWLQQLPSKFGVQVKIDKQITPSHPQDSKPKQQVKPKAEERVKPEQQPKKRGQDHQMFQGLTNLVLKDQQHNDQGYKFSYYISSESQIKVLNQKYMPFAQKLKSNSKKHEDKSFPQKLASLTDRNPPSKSDIPDVTLLKWKHYIEMFKQPQLFHKGIDPNDIHQGQLGDCYFLCSLASLAEYNHLIQRLFQYIDIQNGYFLVWLCLDGIWKLIQLDGYIPTKPNGKNLVFSRCTDGDEELWVILLQKAYAKAYGNYEHIIGGQPYEAIKDLTGAPGQSFSHRKKEINPDILWQKLSRANRQKFMMTCGTDNSDQGEMKLDDHSQSVTAEGIVIGHAYSILDVTDYKGERLIQLRNPWGTMQWKGPWSDGSAQWTQQAKSALKYTDGKDDGIFWMPFEVYFSRYATTAINYIRPDYFYHSQTKKNISNLVIKFNANVLKHGFVMVAQQDHRKKGLPQNTPYNVCHLIGANCKDGKVIHILEDEKYMYQRQGCVEIDPSKVSSDSQFVVLINLERGTDITLCTYSDRKFEYECDDSFDEMLRYIEAMALMQDKAKNIQSDKDKNFKSWLTSVGQYAFLVFKNITNRPITIMIELKQPKNITLLGQMKVQMTLSPGEGDTIQGKIIEQKQPYSFGPMSFGMK